MCLFSRVTPPPHSAHFTCWKLMRNCTHSTAVPKTQVPGKRQQTGKTMGKTMGKHCLSSLPSAEAHRFLSRASIRLHLKILKSPFRGSLRKKTTAKILSTTIIIKAFESAVVSPQLQLERILFHRLKWRSHYQFNYSRVISFLKKSPYCCSFGGFPFLAPSSCVGI